MDWIRKIFGRVSKREEIIQSLERIYYDLKKQNPDKDEHWLLASTWIARYGDWEVSKQKGAKWTKDIAYRDTFQFSILNAPRSIRGLALFLAYKELGKESKEDVSESAHILEVIQQLSDGGKLLDVYKQKNPLTWKQIESEQDESISPVSVGLYGFLKTSDYLNKNPDEMERAMRGLERFNKGEEVRDSKDIKFTEEQIAEKQRK